jgi:hypothetical protein
MDEALKALADQNTPTPTTNLSTTATNVEPKEALVTPVQTKDNAVTFTKEAPVAAQSKVEYVKKWFTLHPKVQAAFVALGLVAALNGQGVYDGTETAREGIHRTVGAVIVAVVAYLKKSNGSAV